MSNTDVRKWAAEHGIGVSGRGPIPADLRAKYDAAQGHGRDRADTIVFGPGAYDGGVTEADFPPAPEGDDRGTADDLPRPARVQAGTPDAVDRPAAREEIRPQKIRAPGIVDRLRGRATGKPAAKPAAPKRARKPRVSLAGLIEDIWGQMAWAAAPLPPMQRLMHAQAPMAGIALEDALRGTMVDRALQPFARAEDKAKAVGGLMLPPMALMGVLATAPTPQQIETPEGGYGAVMAGTVDAA